MATKEHAGAFLLPPSKQHGGFSTVLQNAVPSRTQCCCIGTFKNPAVKETCKMPKYSSDTIFSIRLLKSSGKKKLMYIYIYMLQLYRSLA